MDLETANSPSLPDATPDDVRQAIADDRRRGEFVVLSRGRQHYIQAAGEGDGFTLEFRDGGARSHFRCVREVTRGELEAAFLSYLADDGRWRNDFCWEPAGLLR